jgi:hypothetical protein
MAKKTKNSGPKRDANTKKVKKTLPKTSSKTKTATKTLTEKQKAALAAGRQKRREKVLSSKLKNTKVKVSINGEVATPALKKKIIESL